MAQGYSGQITLLLNRVTKGDKEAESEVISVIYPELKKLASRYLSGERQNHGLQTTALVHEAYLRIVKTEKVEWRSRVHFVATAATVMRLVLVDYARSRLAKKRGGGRPDLSLDDALTFTREQSAQMLGLDEALRRLAQRDLRGSRVVELRFFGGMTVPETAAALGVAEKTVKRDWQAARAWLFGELGSRGRNHDAKAVGTSQRAVRRGS